MSLDARFTQLRQGDSRLRSSGLTDLRQQFASARSRKLALQLSSRAGIQTSLALKRSIGVRGGIQQARLGVRGGRIGKLRVRGVGRANFGGERGGIGRGGGLGARGRFNRSRRSSISGEIRPRGGRSSSVGRLARSQSLQSLNARAASPAPFRSGGRGKGRGFGTRRGNRGGSSRGSGGFRNGILSSGGGGISGALRGRVQRRGRGGLGTPNRGAGGRGRGRGGGNFRRGSGGGTRGRGGGRGRGGRGRGRGGQQGPPPTKEKLDQELDEYMSCSKAYLDKDIDTYMSQTQ